MATIKEKSSQRSPSQSKARLRLKKNDSIHLGPVKFNLKKMVKLKVLKTFSDDFNIRV